MSSYALGAIQMMTPSTFRRRNVTGRGAKNNTNGSGLHPGNSFKSNHHHQTAFSKSRSNNAMNNARLNNDACPPSTLTLHDQPSASSGNIGFSQLTMSQLSDSMSYSRSWHGRSNTAAASLRPLTVARTINQTRPSSLNLNCNNDEILRRRQNPKPRLTSMASKSAFSSVTKPKKLDMLVSNRSRRTNMNQHPLGEPERDTFEDTQQDSSQLWSQPIVLSPPRNAMKNTTSRPTASSKRQVFNSVSGNNSTSKKQSTETTTSSKFSTAAAPEVPSRKRSWMEACIDVMKTPYRTGKSIAQKIKKIKVDMDEKDTQHLPVVKFDDDNAEVTANGNPNALQKPISYETPIRMKEGNKLNKQQGSETKYQASSTDNCSSTSSILVQSKELLLEMEKMKQDIENQRVEFEKSKSDALDEINRKSVMVEKEKEVLELIKKEYEVLRDNVKEAQQKLSVHVCSAEEIFNSKMYLLDTKHSTTLEEIKKYQMNITRALEEKEKNLDAKFSSYKISFKEKSSKDVIQNDNGRGKYGLNGVDQRKSEEDMQKTNSSSLYSTSTSSKHGNTSDFNDNIPTDINNSDRIDETMHKTSNKHSLPSSDPESVKRTTKRVSQASTDKEQGTSYDHEVSDSKQASQIDTTSSCGCADGLNLITPSTAAKRKCVKGKSGARQQARYDLRSRKSNSNHEEGNSNDIIGNNSNRTQNSNEQAEFRCNRKSTTEPKISNITPSSSTSTSLTKNEKIIKKSKSLSQETNNTTMHLTNATNPVIKSYAGNPSTRRRRRVNGRAKLMRSPICAHDNVSQKRPGIEKMNVPQATPKNQGITTPRDTEVRRMSRMRQFRRILQPKAYDSFMSVDLPILPDIGTLARDTDRTRNNFIKPRVALLPQADSDSLSFA